jgi:hypothetical protein
MGIYVPDERAEKLWYEWFVDKNNSLEVLISRTQHTIKADKD